MIDIDDYVSGHEDGEEDFSIYPLGCEFCNPEHPTYDVDNCVFASCNGEFAISSSIPWSECDELDCSITNDVNYCPMCGRKLK